jgi:hypothetical protein
MNNDIGLSGVIKGFFGWHGARVACVVHLILGLIQVRTVNLVQIAQAFGGAAKSESHYKRLQRLFRSFELDLDRIARFVAALVAVERFALTMDRTNWKIGRVDINLLVVGIAYKGTAFPLLWMTLPKRGNSNTAERIRILSRCLRLFGKERIRCLLADREFVGYEWFSYLLEQQILMRIRIKNNTKVASTRGRKVAVRNLFRDLRPGQCKVLSGKRDLWGHALFIVGLKTNDGDFLIVATQELPETALSDYAERWEIETLFGCLKSRGFDFEATRMTEYDRIEKLLAFLAIAFSWAHITGEWLHARKPIEVKKHGRPAKSIFRYGLDHLRHCLLNKNDRNQVSALAQAARHLARKLQRGLALTPVPD